MSRYAGLLQPIGRSLQKWFCGFSQGSLYRNWREPQSYLVTESVLLDGDVYFFEGLITKLTHLGDAVRHLAVEIQPSFGLSESRPESFHACPLSAISIRAAFGSGCTYETFQRCFSSVRALSWSNRGNGSKLHREMPELARMMGKSFRKSIGGRRGREALLEIQP